MDSGGTNLVKIIFSDSLSVRKTNELKNTMYWLQTYQVVKKLEVAFQVLILTFSTEASVVCDDRLK